jgi:glycosyltransferase involved in cell wall biosynthesis
MSILAISVVVPAFRAARTLGETLASIRAQTLAPAEILVVDDGSPDETAAVAAAAGARVLRQANAGVAAATNAGIAATAGNLVALCDADDLWLPEKLAVQAALLADPAVDAALCHFESFACPTLPPEQRARMAVPGVKPGWLRSCLLLRRAAFRRVGDLDATLRVGEMVDWLDRARAAGLVFALAPEVLVRRRLHPGSLSNSQTGNHQRYVEMARRALARRRGQAT